MNSWLTNIFVSCQIVEFSLSQSWARAYFCGSTRHPREIRSCPVAGLSDFTHFCLLLQHDFSRSGYTKPIYCIAMIYSLLGVGLCSYGSRSCLWFHFQHNFLPSCIWRSQCLEHLFEQFIGLIEKSIFFELIWRYRLGLGAPICFDKIAL